MTEYAEFRAQALAVFGAALQDLGAGARGGLHLWIEVEPGFDRERVTGAGVGTEDEIRSRPADCWRIVYPDAADVDPDRAAERAWRLCHGIV